MRTPRTAGNAASRIAAAAWGGAKGPRRERPAQRDAELRRQRRGCARAGRACGDATAARRRGRDRTRRDARRHRSWYRNARGPDLREKDASATTAFRLILLRTQSTQSTRKMRGESRGNLGGTSQEVHEKPANAPSPCARVAPLDSERALRGTRPCVGVRARAAEGNGGTSGPWIHVEQPNKSGTRKSPLPVVWFVATSLARDKRTM